MLRIVLIYLSLIFLGTATTARAQLPASSNKMPMIISGGNASLSFQSQRHKKIYKDKPFFYQAQVSFNFIPYLYFTGRAKKYSVKGISRISSDQYKGIAKWNQETRALGIRLSDGDETGISYIDFLAILTTVKEHIWTKPYNEKLDSYFVTTQEGWEIIIGVAPKITDITYLSLELGYVEAIHKLEENRSTNLGGVSVSFGLVVGIL